jgi:hypothetical protein
MPAEKYDFAGFTHEEADAIRLQAVSFWEIATTTQEPLFALVNDLERVARVQLPKELADKFQGVEDMAQLMPPDAYINLRSLAAGLFRLIFSRKPYGRLSVEGRPNERTERITKAEWTLQNNLDMQNEGAGYESQGVEAIYQTLYAGITCTVTDWVQRFERKAQRGADSQLLLDKNKQIVFKHEKVAEYAETRHIDIRRVRIDPSVSDLRHRRIVGFQSVNQFSQLQVMKGMPNSYIKFDDDELWKTSFDRDLYYQYLDGEANAYSERGRENTDFGDKLVERWEIRGMFRKDNDGKAPSFQDLIVVIGNRNELIGLSPNNLPIAGWDLFDFPHISPHAGRAFRMGVLEPLLDELIEMFIKGNQSLDESNQTTHGMYVADSAAAQTVEDYIQLERGRVVKLDLSASGLNDVRQAFGEFPRPQSTQETFRQKLQLKAEFKEGMGVSDYLGGTDPERTETATGVTALITGGTANLEMMVFLLKNSMFSPNWRKTLILHNFFKGHEENTVYDLKGQPIKVLPGDLDFFYKIDIDVATALDHPAMVRRFVESYPTMIGDPYWDQFEIRSTLKDVLQLPNGDKLLPPSQYLADIIERENIALLNGLGIFVSQFDPHSAHIIGHTKTRDIMIQQGIPTGAIDEHILEHQQMQEQQQEQSGSLGNTKEYGGNTGQNLSSENAANKSIPAAGQQRRRVS